MREVDILQVSQEHDYKQRCSHHICSTIDRRILGTRTKSRFGMGTFRYLIKTRIVE